MFGKAQDLVRLHQRLGHVGFKRLLQIVKKGATLDVGKLAVSRRGTAQSQEAGPGMPGLCPRQRAPGFLSDAMALIVVADPSRCCTWIPMRSATLDSRQSGGSS